MQFENLFSIFVNSENRNLFDGFAYRLCKFNEPQSFWRFRFSEIAVV